MRRRIWILVSVLAGIAAGWLWQANRASRPSTSGDAASIRTSQEHRPLNTTAAGDSAWWRRVPDALRAREAEAEIFGRFDHWAAEYLAQTDSEARRAAVAAGVAAARERRSTLRGLIASDPERALQHAVPWAVRAAMPAEVVALLEERVDGVGKYDAIAALAPVVASADFRAARRQLEIGGRRYEVFAYGRRLEFGSRGRLAVHGIAVDERLALLDSPVRVLDPGEPVAAGRRIEEVCAVSGQPTDAAVAPAADTGDRVIYLCSAGHIALLASELEQSEGDDSQSGGGSSASDAGSGTAALDVQGTRRVLMIRVRFADQASTFEPETQGAAESMFGNAARFYAENSFGALRIEGTVSPVYTLPQSAAWYAANDTSGFALNVLNAARAVAAAPASVPGNEGLPAFDYLAFDLEVVRYTGGPGAFSGQGYVGMRGCWLKSSDPGVLVHELGHNLGLWHANAWAPLDALSPLGAGSNAEYGDVLDTMGPARGGAWHFNAWEKHHLGWLDDSAVATVGASVRVALRAHDLGGTLEAARPHAVKIVRDEERDYWLELRRHEGWLSSRSDVREGIGVRWDPWSRSNGGTHLLDATPESPFGRDDATLAFGRTFSDRAAGIHITPLGFASDDPSAVEVEVQLGAFSGNRAPSVAAAASVTSAQAGQSVQFLATASDPDGDALSFTWSFDESGGTVSGANVAHTWMADGDHRARVTVSDRRGGTASASVLVRVGTVSGSRIVGRVLDLSGQPIAGALVANSTESGIDGYRRAWSDADGSFALLGVPTGTWNVVASAPGWIFAMEGFDRPVSTPSFAGEVTILGCWKGFAISGTVRRADGSAISGAMVSTGQQSEPTDRFGEFRITGLNPGRHVLSVTAADAIFDPTIVELGDGDVDTVFLGERTFTVAGTVNGSAVGGVTVTTGWQSTTTSATGRFELSGVPAGAWALRAVSPGTTYSPADFTEPLLVSGNTAALTLATDPAPRYAVSGIVRDRGLGLAGVTVSGGDATTQTDSLGGYWLAGLAAGRHEITVTAPGVSFDTAIRSVEVSTGHVTGIDFSTNRENQAPVLVEPPQAIGAVDQPFVTLTAGANDDDGASLVRYWWSAADDSADVAFTANGAHAARETIARFGTPGVYRLRVTAVDRHGAERSDDLVLTVQGGAAAPTIVEAARAEPAIIGADLKTRLSVRAVSGMGDAQLVYTWTPLAADGSSEPERLPGPVFFSANGTTASRDIVAQFRSPGNYLLRVEVRDPLGQTAESSVAVRVETTYASWLSDYFESNVLTDPIARARVAGELADPDGDGIVNLLEYAFGGDPSRASPEARPRTHIIMDQGVEYLAVTFRPNPNAIDLLYEPQVSGDLESWQAGLVFVPGEDEREVTYRDFAPASDHRRRFIRVEVTRPESQAP